ncbi:VanZ family protein [Erythrobacter sp. SCSIO 43205]|uniref:VanZ family protein n=1 Tax=Erythrobacter sp. SCSIO 43205 TaxID=2779361 RepID=UPI001CA88120|nr:VanZ family protein [Erythrobacter sp. SCSIO 43205]
MLTKLFQIAFWFALALAFLAASLPNPAPLSDALNDKQLHALAFVVLATLAALAFPQLSLTRVFVGLAVFGGLIELVQSIPSLGRKPSFMDWLADIIGAGSTLMLFGLYRSFRARSAA